ncbi:uncharacterized protein LOC110685214 [Chenopodium quinoa]|uniref:uncharacterized protein LOC110685214 n=1 Tax=Chenopodium quinoa TaxID=63459 RepID=UPI000B770BF6|nr:uncharacterized protein LOC110685214 [Chenopodium quinoa]
MEILSTTQYIPAKVNSQIQFFSSATHKLVIQKSIPYFFKPKIQSNICCRNHEKRKQTVQRFSQLESDPPWESGSVWSTMALYIFSLHVPLSFGGLSVIANLLHLTDLEPQIKAVAILLIEILELFSAVLLLQFTAKHKPIRFFQVGKKQNERNWISSALLGFAILILAMFFVEFVGDKLVAPKDMNNQVVKEILLSGNIAQTACTLVYCVVAPLLEEIVYRRFFLTSLSSSMEWYQAVMISSLIFSAAHLSAENFIQLVLVGMVLGCSYCWTGDLRSSILLHSMYNALTLLITVLD